MLLASYIVKCFPKHPNNVHRTHQLQMFGCVLMEIELVTVITTTLTYLKSFLHMLAICSLVNIQNQEYMKVYSIFIMWLCSCLFLAYKPTVIK